MADDRYARIYANDAESYERLVAAEDPQRNVLGAVGGLVALDGAQVLEVGAGTGRLTRQLLACGARVVAVEPSAAMRAVAARELAHFDAARWELREGDARTLEAGRGWAELAIAGWVLGHFRRWYAGAWREEIGGALDRMAAALRPGGTLVLVETLGTGREEPAPPDEALAEYYAWLREARGFESSWVRTDYAFASVEEAAATTGFFFGEAFGESVRSRGRAEVPECTGVFWRRFG